MQKLTPREMAFVQLLLISPLSTLEAEQAIGSSRISNQGLALRKKLGVELPCTLEKYTRLNGTAGTKGVYRLTDSDKVKVGKALGSQTLGAKP